MPGTRTAPATTGAPTSVTLTLHLIDSSGDLFTDEITTVAGAPAPAVEAYVAAYQAVTQASVYKVTESLVWEGVESPTNAAVGQRNSIKDGINILYRNATTLVSKTLRVAAPDPAVMDANTDTVNVSAAPFAAFLSAVTPLLTGFSSQSVQYTERRERSNNPRTKL